MTLHLKIKMWEYRFILFYIIYTLFIITFITEHGNQYSWVYFDKLKKDYPDIKMIYGVELYECFDMHIQDPNSKYFHLIALAKIRHLLQFEHDVPGNINLPL